MQNDLVKLCPQCGSEFQTWVERCLDCGASLVPALEGQGAEVGERAEETAEKEAAGPPDCIHLRTAEVDWILRISEDLNEAGIRHWVTPSTGTRALNLFVLPSDQEKAALIDQTRYAIEISAAAEGAGRPQRPDRPRLREPSADDLDVKLCPSCGGEYQLWAETCADCGVPLVRPWDLDSARESAAPPAARSAFAGIEEPGACPACGAGLSEGALECAACGLVLAQPEDCPNCGEELEMHLSKCQRCGHDLFASAEG